jgi:ABC-type transporter Mla subunit MlaD
MFVEAFKAQQAKINALQQQNETLANQLNQQQQTIETLQTSVEKLLKVIDTAKE